MAKVSLARGYIGPLDWPGIRRAIISHACGWPSTHHLSMIPRPEDRRALDQAVYLLEDAGSAMLSSPRKHWKCFIDYDGPNGWPVVPALFKTHLDLLEVEKSVYALGITEAGGSREAEQDLCAYLSRCAELYPSKDLCRNIEIGIIRGTIHCVGGPSLTIDCEKIVQAILSLYREEGYSEGLTPKERGRLTGTEVARSIASDSGAFSFDDPYWWSFEICVSDQYRWVRDAKVGVEGGLITFPPPQEQGASLVDINVRLQGRVPCFGELKEELGGMMEKLGTILTDL